MKPQVRVFTRDNPCTKRDLWACFRGPMGFRRVQVIVAQSQIGANAPRVMERNGHLVRNNTPQGDFYTLTDSGREWLTKGINAYVKNHPAERAEIEFLEDAAPPARRVTRRR